MTSPPQDAEQQLVALEDQTAAQVNGAVEDAIGAAGLTAAALTALTPTVVAAIEQAAAQALQLGIGMAVAASGARLATGRAGARAMRGLARRSPVADMGARLREVVAAAREDLTRKPEDERGVFDRLKATLRRAVITLINEAAGAGVELAARALGATGLLWLTDATPCPVCDALGGTVTPLGEPFPDDGPAWHGYRGRPPRHPNCRCRIRPVWGETPAGRARRRRARRGTRSRRAGRRSR